MDWAFDLSVERVILPGAAATTRLSDVAALAFSRNGRSAWALLLLQWKLPADIDASGEGRLPG